MLPFESNRTTSKTPSFRQVVVHPISQAIVQIDEADAASAFEHARSIALKWMAQKVGQKLPDGAWAGESFHQHQTGAQPAEAIAIAKDGYKFWAAKCDDADKRIAKQVWTTEITLGLDHAKLLFGTRLLCSSRKERITSGPSIPRCVSAVISELRVLLDGRQISVDPWLIDSTDRVSELVSLLKDSKRRHTTFVFSLPATYSDSSTVYTEATNVAKRLAGTAHIAIITEPMTFILTEMIGKRFSVFNESVRTYRAGFDLLNDESFDHPIATRRWISERNVSKPQSFENILVGQTLRHSISDPTFNQDLPRFSQFRQFSASLLREENRTKMEELERSQAVLRAESSKLSSDRENLQLELQQKGEAVDQLRTTIRDLEKDLSNLQNDSSSELNEYVALLDDLKQERIGFEEQARQFRSENIALRYRIDALETQLELDGRSNPPSIPDTLDDFEGWCDEHLAGSVVVLKRALRGAKDSYFEDVELIYRSMLLLRDSYVPARRRRDDKGSEVDDKDLMERFKTQCTNLGIKLTNTFSGPRHGETGDEYFVRYAGEKRLLDQHLKKGNNRDRRHCLRVYFFWHDESQQVIIGWLPSHLRTRTS